jgi:hypothetical protein
MGDHDDHPRVLVDDFQVGKKCAEIMIAEGDFEMHGPAI